MGKSRIFGRGRLKALILAATFGGVVGGCGSRDQDTIVVNATAGKKRATDVSLTPGARPAPTKAQVLRKKF